MELPDGTRAFLNEEREGCTDSGGRLWFDRRQWPELGVGIRSVDLCVSHPDFVRFRDRSFAIGPGIHTVVLRSAAKVVVSGWIAGIDGLVTDLSIQVDRMAVVSPESWRREPDGRLSTRSISPGFHLIWLEHQSEEYGHYFSDVESFEVPESGNEVLNLELHPAGRLAGIIDERIPRPIIDGRILFRTDGTHPDNWVPPLSREFEAPIQADGGFSLENLPRGRGQVFALCRGWVTQRTLADSAAEAGIGLAGSVSPEQERNALLELGDRAYLLPRVTIPPVDDRFVVFMEPTATVELVVRLSDGRPVSGAQAEAFPYLRFIDGAQYRVPWRPWEAETDTNGRAWIEDLPPDSALSLRVDHRRYQLLDPHRRNRIAAEVRSGETATVEVVMKSKGD